ncbi:MAG: phenylalanine--tRNA ligase subunit beta, partial [Gammaproteobacteria bacterium]|nr:phenylalanine--tRNA ligase subunit beta [Gammaproteobacteria bacterium]
VEETVEVSLLEDEIRVAAGNLLQNITLFDVFKGKNLEDNTKSLAFGLTFQSKLGNLTAMEVDKLIENIVSVLKSRANARLRE